MFKKITLSALAFIGCMAMNAQSEIYSEDFDDVSVDQQGVGSLPSDWSLYDEDGLNPNQNSQAPLPSFIDEAWKVINFQDIGKTAVSTSWYDPAGQADDWMVTPEISLPNGSVSLFYTVRAFSGDFADDYEVLVSTTGNTPSDFTDDPVFSEADPLAEGVEQIVSLADYAGEDVYIAFRNVGDDEYALIMDDISVREVPEIEVEAVSVDNNDQLATGDNTIKATVKNSGSSEITSFDASYQIDGGQEVTQNITGLSIESFTSDSFSFDTPWDAEMGDHTIDVTISNVNGEGDDANTDNNSVSKDVSVIATNSVQRSVLYEEFTSSSCPPCAAYNGPTLSPFIDGLEDDSYALVKYQVNFPAPGDPYYTAEVGVRGQYYQVTAAPTLLLGGVVDTQMSIAAQQASFDVRSEVPSFIDMSVTGEINAGAVSATVDMTPYIDGDYTLFVAVVEKLTTGNASTNGETEFENVMMKMLPDAQGTDVTFSADDSQTMSFDNIDLSNTNVEEIDDLKIVAFVMDPGSKEAMQSADTNITDLSVGDNSLTEVAMYPNPSHGTLNIDSKKPVNVSITNMTGQAVFSQDKVTNAESLNLSNLSSGVYFVNIDKNDSSVTKKLIVK